MTQFCLAHPWMTFWLIVLTLITIEETITAFAPYCSSNDDEEGDTK